MPTTDPRALQSLYFDEARTHEILTSLESGPGGLALTVIELPYGSRDPADAVTRAETLTEPWEARLVVKELEARLAASGERYYRVTPDALQPALLPFVAQPGGDYKPREVTVPGPGDRPLVVRYAHYHRPDGLSRLQLAVPRPDLLPLDRHLLAAVDFRFPDTASAEPRVLHGRLASGTLRQQWVDAHLDLPRAGFRRLATARDYAGAFGSDWQDAMRSSCARALTRLLDTADAPARPAAPPPPPPSAPAGTLLDVARPLVLGLRRSFLAPAEEEALIAQGEIAIRKFVAGRRRTAAHDQQAALSLLEAALLVLDAARKDNGRALVEEGRRLRRLVQDYERARRPVAVVAP